jgi:hypothetical protein
MNLNMRTILLVSTLLFGLKSYSQDKIFTYEIKSVVHNGNRVSIPKGKAYSIVCASGDKGTQIFTYDGNTMLSSGDALLVRHYRKAETGVSYAGRVNEYSWNRIHDDGSKEATKIKFRVAFTPTEATFICDVVAGKNVFQYQGVVYDISKPFGEK